jgi:gliding motility-associatede transport system auxiliary component
MSAAKVVDLLAPIGIVVAAGAFLAEKYGKVLPGGLAPYLIAAAVLVLAHLILRWESIGRAVGARQLRHGGNSALLVLVVLGILVAVNYIAYRRPLKKDLTKNQRHSLSDQTRKVVGGLRDEVRVLYFQRAAELVGADERLKQYQALSPNLKTEFVDPYEKPTRAREYEVKGPWPILVVERGPRRERVASDSEQDLTNAIVKVTRDSQKTVCFAEGEGERDVEDGGDLGYTGAKEALTKSQYLVKKVALARERAVPADCAVVVMAGPQADPLPQVVDAVKAFVAGGGKALVMAEPPLKVQRPALDGLLASWNLEAGKDVVVDVSGVGQMFGAGELTPLALEYPYHEITRGFRVMTAFHEARSLQAGAASIPGVSAQNLVQTSDASWAETDLTLKAPVQPDGADKRGPVSLGAVATVTVAGAPSPAPSPAASPSPDAEEEPPAPSKQGRVVAFGDADFASNALLPFQGNRDFFLNVVAWLAEDADLISIRPREPEDQRLFLTQIQQQTVAFVALLLLPGLFVALGVWTWWQRR